jgi:hypothetical protein
MSSSDNDDLEQALQENLKLRRQLRQKITKARDRNAKDRVGWALYWTLLALAGIWMLVCLWMLHGGSLAPRGGGIEHAIEVFLQNPLEQLALMGIPALLLYSLGRVIRYVLSGE